MQEQPESPTTVITDSEHVQFQCQITPPYREPLPPVPEDVAPPQPPPKLPPPPPCCPLLPPGASSDLVEALPTILVGIGFAWAIGMVTGAFIFSAPSE